MYTLLGNGFGKKKNLPRRLNTQQQKNCWMRRFLCGPYSIKAEYLSLLGNGLVNTFPRQRGVVGIVSYAVRVVSKESRRSFLPRKSRYKRILRNHFAEHHIRKLKWPQKKSESYANKSNMKSFCETRFVLFLFQEQGCCGSRWWAPSCCWCRPPPAPWAPCNEDTVSQHGTTTQLSVSLSDEQTPLQHASTWNCLRLVLGP
jgi:hypothetical protein